MATFAPSAARRLAIAAPMPRDPPVMSAIFPSSFFDIVLLLLSTTVSLTLIYVAARASIQFSDNIASEHEAQGGDGIGNVALRALGCRVGCNLGVGKVFLIE